MQRSRALFAVAAFAMGASPVAACGARTGLLGADVVGGVLSTDGGVDAPLDGPRDAPVDRPRDVACGAGPARELDVWIAFDSLRAGNRDIYAIRPGGCDLRRLTTEIGDDREPAFSRDGKLLAYSAGQGSIGVMDLATGATAMIADGGVEPSFSPDGRRIAFRRDGSIFSIGVDGTGEVLEAAGDPGPTGYAHPIFTADSASLVADRRDRIEVIPAGSGIPVVLVGPGTDIVETPSLDLDGKVLAFSAICEPRVESIWRAPFGAHLTPCVDGTRMSRMGDSFSRRPAIGPQGFIAYERGVGFAEIVLVPAAGGTPFNVSSSGTDDRNPSWSPIGTSLP